MAVLSPVSIKTRPYTHRMGTWKGRLHLKTRRDLCVSGPTPGRTLLSQIFPGPQGETLWQDLPRYPVHSYSMTESAGHPHCAFTEGPCRDGSEDSAVYLKTASLAALGATRFGLQEPYPFKIPQPHCSEPEEPQ